MTFGEKLYRLRKEGEMSQEALAASLGVSRQAISRWELGEVVPDTENVLAVGRLFGVSTDYLLRDECDSEEETPAVQTAEKSLRERQAAVGKGFLCRVFWLAPVTLFHQTRLGLTGSLPFWWLLAVEAVFSTLLYRLNRQYWREGGSQRTLLVPDLLAFACVFFLPYLLEGLAGGWGVLLGQLAAVVPLVKSIKTLRLHYGLSWGKGK